MFEKYRLPRVTSDKLVRTWNSNQMQFWQNQMNFAVWCATTGCGVSAEDHLAAPEPLMQSLYYFHVYYQMRRILDELQAPCPRIERGAPSITHTIGERTNRYVTSLGFRPPHKLARKGSQQRAEAGLLLCDPLWVRAGRWRGRRCWQLRHFLGSPELQ